MKQAGILPIKQRGFINPQWANRHFTTSLLSLHVKIYIYIYIFMCAFDKKPATCHISWCLKCRAAQISRLSIDGLPSFGGFGGFAHEGLHICLKDGFPVQATLEDDILDGRLRRLPGYPRPNIEGPQHIQSYAIYYNILLYCILYYIMLYHTVLYHIIYIILYCIILY